MKTNTLKHKEPSVKKLLNEAPKQNCFIASNSMHYDGINTNELFLSEVDLTPKSSGLISDF